MTNAIEERLSRIEESWLSFRDNPSAKLARWHLDGDGQRMVDVFHEVQVHEGSDVPDFFVRLREPFEDLESFGLELRRSFIGEVEAAHDEMLEAEVDTDWTAPELTTRDGLSELLKCLHSFRTHYESLIESLVVVVLPETIADSTGWTGWLTRLVEGALPPGIRFSVVDRVEQSALDDLAEQHQDTVVTLDPELDMPGALDSLVRAVGSSGPPDLFRRHFVALSTSAKRGNFDGAVAHGQLALQVARKQQWAQQAAVVHMALGGLYLGAGRIEEAAAAYRAAGEAVAHDEEPGSDKVEIHARLGEGSVLLGDGDFAGAAEAYDHAAPRAENAEDHFLAVDAWRMAGYCYQRLGNAEISWDRLGHAVVAGEKIPEDQRQQTTLPWVGEALLEMTRTAPYDRWRETIEARLLKLLGPAWQTLLPDEDAAS